MLIRLAKSQKGYGNLHIFNFSPEVLTNIHVSFLLGFTTQIIIHYQERVIRSYMHFRKIRTCFEF